MMKKKKIIIVSTVGLMYDGITSVIMSYLQAMNLEKFDIYVVSTIKSDNTIKKTILDLGCHVIELPSRKTETLKYLLCLIKCIRTNQIEVLHAHGNSATLAIEMLAGWAGGCKKRIAHSHNTQCEQVQADKWLRPLFYLLYTDAFACGEDAGKWLFGTRSFIVLNNGRNLEKFAFDPHLREKMRLRYKIDSELAFGHVGGFNPQKNHKFVLDVFRAIIQEEPNAKCFFIGTGPLKNVIEKQSTDLKDNIIFVGNTDEVPAYLDMMDGMILPSLFEGLPLVAIEWQINGLPCILSDTITLQCAVTDELKFMSLDVSPYQWARRIIIDAKKNVAVRAEKSAESKEMVKRAGFDISENVKLLEKAYTE